MLTNESIKEVVKEKYGSIAERAEAGTDGCGCGCSTADDNFVGEDYSKLEGYEANADLGLGCGLPTEFARIQEGDTVLDLGSGAGNDCFVARALVGQKGRVIGVDMTEKMVEKAKLNASKLGHSNVEFRLGEIEDLPVENSSVDVVVSNCVMNLVPNKRKGFSETFRVLKPKGHFSISDIVTTGKMPEKLQNDLAMYVGCVSGAITEDDYLSIIREAGFTNVVLQKKRKIELTDDQLSQYMNDQEIEQYQRGEFGVYSITVYAEKPCC